MIAIINEGPFDQDLHAYRIQINNELVCRFTHDRKKGLAQCLRDAARAVDRWHRLAMEDDEVAVALRGISR
jgi:hypothetical protein